MGACISSNAEELEQKKKSQFIDRGLEADSKRLRRECKILLLGTKAFSNSTANTGNRRKGSGESGKSTIVKQMKIIHQNGYTVDELALYRMTVYKNLVDCAKALIGAMRQFSIEPKDSANIEYCDFLMNYNVDPDPHTSLSAKVGTAVLSLWADPCIEALMERQSEFYLMDSAP